MIWAPSIMAASNLRRQVYRNTPAGLARLRPAHHRNPMAPSTRRATNADALAVAETFIASRATMTYLPKLHTDDDTRQHFATVVANKETWVAERDGKGVGFAVIDGGFLEHLYVHPSRFNTGTGDKLFRQVTSQHPQGFQFWAFQKNTGARRFYERPGCALEKLTDGADNEEKEPDV